MPSPSTAIGGTDYTPQQLQELENRRHVVGEDRIREAEGEWKQLLEQIRSEMAKGMDPASETVQRLGKRYQGLIDEFTGGNKEIEESLRRMYKAQSGKSGSARHRRSG